MSLSDSDKLRKISIFLKLIKNQERSNNILLTNFYKETEGTPKEFVIYLFRNKPKQILSKKIQYVFNKMYPGLEDKIKNGKKAVINKRSVLKSIDRLLKESLVIDAELDTSVKERLPEDDIKLNEKIKRIDNFFNLLELRNIKSYKFIYNLYLISRKRTDATKIEIIKQKIEEDRRNNRKEVKYDVEFLPLPMLELSKLFISRIEKNRKTQSHNEVVNEIFDRMFPDMVESLKKGEVQAVSKKFVLTAIDKMLQESIVVHEKIIDPYKKLDEEPEENIAHNEAMDDLYQQPHIKEWQSELPKNTNTRAKTLRNICIDTKAKCEILNENKNMKNKLSAYKLYKNTHKLTRKSKVDHPLIKKIILETINDFPTKTKDNIIHQWEFSKEKFISCNTSINITATDSILEVINLHAERPVLVIAGNRNVSGGGWENGTETQEAMLNYCSTYSMSQIKSQECYSMERHDIIYSNEVLIFRNHNTPGFKIIHPNNAKRVAVLNCPPINRPKTNLELQKPINTGESFEVYNQELFKSSTIIIDKKYIEERIIGIFETALFNGHNVIVLDSWGCIDYFNPPYAIARAFAKILPKYKNRIKKIIFATGNKLLANIFNKVIKC